MKSDEGLEAEPMKCRSEGFALQIIGPGDQAHAAAKGVHRLLANRKPLDLVNIISYISYNTRYTI